MKRLTARLLATVRSENMWLLFASSVGPIIANALIWLASHIALLPRWVKPIGWVAAAGVAVGVLLLTLIRLYYRKSASQIISLYGSAYMVGLSARRRRFVRNWIAAVATLSTFGFLGGNITRTGSTGRLLFSWLISRKQIRNTG